MKATDILNLLGGLALFLYGMQMMSNGLEAAAGKKMQKILERLTANRFIGVLVGAGITAIIQPGGAMRDQLSIDKCNEYGIAMVFTGMRHFRH